MLCLVTERACYEGDGRILRVAYACDLRSETRQRLA